MVETVCEDMIDVDKKLEYSKRFKISECWGEKKVAGGKKTLPDVLGKAKEMGINPDASLFDVLFAGMP